MNDAKRDTPINTRSSELVVLLATYNRLGLLQKAIGSIEAETRTPHEVIVIDGGSTDGTIEFLRACEIVTPVFQGRLLGPARAYNKVWKRVRARYSVWLSDDTVVVNQGLDRAVEILDRDFSVGMVGLKMKDITGPWIDELYVGGRLGFGILTCNHGVLRHDLFLDLGGLNEDYPFYGFDPDLTASVLSAGRKVVITRDVSVHHYRGDGGEAAQGRAAPTRDTEGPRRIFERKFGFLAGAGVHASQRVKERFGEAILALMFRVGDPSKTVFGLNRRDWSNLARCWFVSPWVELTQTRRPFHLVQRIPTRFLDVPDNPYRRLCSESTPRSASDSRRPVAAR